ncbi:MAG: hypothetical protein VKJ09_12325 [Leptolyngbya sp.]|nr:hypothetical protein [Leptolyngbya sp.]
MSSSVPAAAPPPVIHYRLTPRAMGIHLELWEPAAAPSSAPYRFRVHADYASEWAAITALQQYLQWNHPVRAIAVAPAPQTASALASDATWSGQG